MKNEVYEPTKDEIIVEMIKRTKNFTKMFLKSGVLMNIIPYAIPYSLGEDNKFKTEEENSPRSFSEAIEILRKKEGPGTVKGLYAGVGAGVIGIGTQVAFYINQVNEGNPEYLLIPLATNVLSGIHKIYKKTKNELKESKLETEVTE